MKENVKQGREEEGRRRSGEERNALRYLAQTVTSTGEKIAFLAARYEHLNNANAACQ